MLLRFHSEQSDAERLLCREVKRPPYELTQGVAGKRLPLGPGNRGEIRDPDGHGDRRMHELTRLGLARLEGAAQHLVTPGKRVERALQRIAVKGPEHPGSAR